MADGKVVIETDLDSSGIETALKKLGNITTKGLKAATTAITGTTVALGGIATAAIKVGSDFESQMSRVKAISGATGEEFNKLKEQAIQLGADTAFSSKQAAEGMENLAAAGFATNEIVDAMPGLLSLAAAAGEDLATSSDIAASTLRGFGLEAQDMAHVADVLAANANRTNSSVAQTGEAMKYIAPLARAAGLSLEETAAAIGIMADAGIQGSQAGTTLRGAISRLSKPTDDMKAAMDELGISFYDSNGKMKSLTEQVGILRKATEGMTDEQKNNLLVTLYGQEALSGMMALINEGEGSLGDLTEAYKNCDGEAQKAAETMQDNLSSALEQLGGSAESLGIVFYESVAENLKKTAQSATDSVNNITEAFKSGGLNEAIQTAGDEFANLATAAAEHAPEMVDTAVDFIESFADGIIDNRGRLYESAVDMAQAIGDGLADLLPDEIGEPVSQAVDEIAESLSSGGLKEAGETIETTLENVIDVVGELADVALPPLTKALDFAGDHFEVIAASTTAAFTAFKGYKIVQETTSALNKGSKIWKTASTAVDAFSAAQLIAMESGTACNVTLTAGQAVVGLLTGKITLATAAQTAWNVAMNANPIGIVITAVGALTAGLVAYKLATDGSKTSQYALTEEQKKANEEIHKQYEAYKELEAARNEAMDGIDAEYGYLTELKNELNGLIDTNGKVKSGYEDRANFIVNELSGALGLEKEQIWEIIHANGNLGDSIDQVIEKKKAEAYLNANEEAYAEAIKNKSNALQTYVGKLAECKEAEEAYNEAQAAATSVMKEHEEMLKVSPEAAEAYILAQNGVLIAAEEAEKAFEKQKKSLGEAEEKYVGYNATIQNYEGLSSAIIAGDADKINLALLKIRNGFITAEQGTEDSLRKQVDSTKTGYEQMKQAVEDGVPGVTNAMVTEAQAMWLMAQIEYEKGTTNNASLIQQWQNELNQLLGSSGSPEAAAQEAKETTQAVTNAVQEGKEPVKQATKNAIEGGVSEGAASADTTTVPAQKGQEAANSAANSLNIGKDSINQAANSAVNEINVGAGSADAATVPAGKGSEATQALVTALNTNSQSVLMAAASLGGQIPQGLISTDILTPIASVGSSVGSSLSSSLAGQGPVVQSSSAGVGNAAFAGLTSVNVPGKSKILGGQISSELAGGITGNVSVVKTSAIDLGNSAATSLKNVNLSEKAKQEGKNLGVGAKDGINSEKGNVETAARNLGDSTITALMDTDMRGSAYDQGLNFSYGLADGISAGSSSAISAAISVASSALAAAKRTLDEHSPSKKTRKFGQFYSQGLALGIEDDSKMVKKSSENIAQIALDSLDLTAISQRMHDVMSFNTNRISRGITGRNINMQHMTENTLKLDYDLLADKISGKMTKAIAGINWTMEMDKKPVGRILAPEINRQMELIKRSERMR